MKSPHTKMSIYSQKIVHVLRLFYSEIGVIDTRRSAHHDQQILFSLTTLTGHEVPVLRLARTKEKKKKENDKNQIAKGGGFSSSSSTQMSGPG